MDRMLSYEEALELLLARIPPRRREILDLLSCGGRILAGAVRADMDLPPFDRSMMDGFAVRASDTIQAPAKLELSGTISAGCPSSVGLEPGRCMRIMTGAPLPPGADAVQMVEKSRLEGEAQVELLESVKPGEHVAFRGGEIRKGDVALPPGRFLGAAEIGVLAAFGHSRVEVFAAPRAAVLSTGDEIVDIDQIPEFGQIRNANAFMIAELCRKLGLDAEIWPIVSDDRDATRQALRQALRRELVIFSGGVSMGERDFVHQVLKEESVEVVFHKAAVKPGKPLLVGRQDDRLIFGLPGNPVSAFVTFQLFVRPAVRRWMGFQQELAPRVRGRLKGRVTQIPGRTFFRPAILKTGAEGFSVEPIETRGSADLVAFSRANALLVMEAEVAALETGAAVEILLLDDTFNQ